MLSRVNAAARESAARDAASRAAATPDGVAAAGVYQPRKGRVGTGLCRFSPEQRAELQRVLGAELCLFKYHEDPNSPTFGQPLPGAPHAIYLDPMAAASGAARAAAVGGVTMLNRGRPLRPSGDSRGWKWRETLTAKRDGSLVFGGEDAVAHVER